MIGFYWVFTVYSGVLGCSLMVLGEFLVVSSWVGVFLDVFECSHKFLVFLSDFWCYWLFLGVP